VEQRGVQIDRVVVAATLLAKVDHPAVPEITYDTPDRSFSEPQVARDLLDRRVGASGNVEEDATLRRKERPARATVAIGVVRVPALPRAGLPLRLLPDSLLNDHSTRVVERGLSPAFSASEGAIKSVAKLETRMQGKRSSRRLLIDGGAAMKPAGARLAPIYLYRHKVFIT